MLWMDYNIESYPDGSFAVKGDWPGEPWLTREGKPKEYALYKPGDRFIVNENGILRKVPDEQETI